MTTCSTCQQLLNLVSCLNLEANILREKIKFLEMKLAFYESLEEPEPEPKKRNPVGFNAKEDGDK